MTKKLATMIMLALTATSHADTYKLGAKQTIKHGCATPYAAAVFDEFLRKDPSFTLRDDKAILTLRVPYENGVHEKSWTGEVVASTVAHWTMPRDKERGTQVRILVDIDPIQWCDNATCTMQTTRIRVSLVQDYDPENNGRHENVCAESWFGQAVRF